MMTRPYLELAVKVWNDNTRTDYREKVEDSFGDEDYLNLKPVDHRWIIPSKDTLRKYQYNTLVVFGSSPSLVKERYELMVTTDDEGS